MDRRSLIISRNSIDGVLFKGKITNLMCLFYLVVWTLVPAFSVNTNSGIFRILFAVILFMWIITAIENLPPKVFFNAVALAGCFFVVMVSYGILHYGDLGFYDVVNYILLFGFAINSILYCRLDNVKLDRIILCFSLIIVLLTIVTTLMGLLTNSDVARLLTSSSTNESAANILRARNIGAFDFIYGLVIIFPVLVSMFRKTRNRFFKCCIFIMIILTSLCVIKSNFTTALILLFIGFWLPFVFSSGKNMVGKLLLIICIAIIASLLFPYFLKLIYSITTSILAKEKIMGILMFLNGTENAGDVTSRVSMFQLSLSNFLSNPIFGVGGYYRITMVLYVGKHAQFIDDLARYGIIGGIPILAFVIYCIKRSILIKPDDSLYKSSLFPSIILFCLLGLLNPIYNYGILVSFFIVATTLARYIDRGNI